MKIIFSHFFSDKNRGDAAILYSMVDSFTAAAPSLDYHILTTQTRGPMDGEKLYSIFYLAYYKPQEAFIRLIRSAYMVTLSAWWAWIVGTFGWRPNFMLTEELRKTLEAYADCDAVVPVGGGYITGKNDMKGNATVFFQLHAIWIALRLRKPVYLYSQSIGPFGNGIQKAMAKYILSQCARIFVREDYSMQTLRDMGIPDGILTRSVDSAFGFKSDKKGLMREYLKKLGVGFDRTVVGITVKKFLSPEKQEKYENSLCSFVRHLASQDKYSILFIPQVTSTEHRDDDRAVELRIYGKLGPDRKKVALMDQDFNCFDIKGIYENLDFLVGTRMHSCIFSLTAKVPVLALQYEYKTGGIMKDLELSEWVILMENVTDDILRLKFEDLQNRREEYLNRLNRVLPEYVQRHNIPAHMIIKEIVSA